MHSVQQACMQLHRSTRHASRQAHIVPLPAHLCLSCCIGRLLLLLLLLPCERCRHMLCCTRHLVRGGQGAVRPTLEHHPPAGGTGGGGGRAGELGGGGVAWAGSPGSRGSRAAACHCGTPAGQATALPAPAAAQRTAGPHRSIRSSTRSVWSSSLRVAGEAAKLTCHMAACRGEARELGP